MSDSDDTLFEDSSSQSSSSIESLLQRSFGCCGPKGTIDTIQSVDIWKIDQFSHFEDAISKKYHCLLQSPKLTYSEGHIVLYPNGISEKENVYIELSLSMPSDTKVRYRFSVIDKNQRATNTVEGEHCFHRDWNSNCIVPKFISKTDLIDLVVDDTLTIAYELNFSNDYKLDSQNYEHKSALANDLQTLYDNQEFSDIKLVARGKVFYAHKNILASRSSFFAAMFRHKMKENVENVVPMRDVRIKVLKEMLHYMYTGTVRDMKMSTAQDLLIVAEKYDIPGLKKISGQILQKKLTIENAINMLILADSHNAIDLKKNTVHFLTENIKEIMGTKALKTALNSHLTLVINTIEEIINLRVV